VNVHPIPAPPTITVRGDTLISSPAFAYQWFHEGTAIEGATERQLVRRLPGWFTVTITDSNGCAASSTPVSVEGHRVWLDSTSGTLGERVRLAFIVAPGLRSADGVDGYTVRLRVEPRDLFAHGALLPAGVTGRLAPSMNASADGSIVVQQTSRAAVVGDTIFLLELQGLATSRPVSRVTIEEATLDGIGTVEVAGDGVVTLYGCEVGSFASGKRVRFVRVTDAGGTLRIVYRAPLGSTPEIVVSDLGGRRVASQVLEKGTELDQAVELDAINWSSGFYVVELRDRDERTATGVLVGK
jgi:hypothetical protein